MPAERGVDRLRDLARLHLHDRIRERRRVGGRHGGSEAAGVLLDARIDRDLLGQSEEVLLRRARRGHLRVDIVGLRPGLDQDVVHLHGRVVREAGLVLLPQGGIRELVGGDGALNVAEQQDPLRQVVQVGPRQVMRGQRGVHRLLTQAGVELRDGLLHLRVGHRDVVRGRVHGDEVLLDQVREREPRARRVRGFVAVDGSARLLVQASQEPEDVLLMGELGVGDVGRAQRGRRRLGAAARGEHEQGHAERDEQAGAEAGSGSHEPRV